MNAKVTLTQFKKWSKANESLAKAVVMATAFAQLERARVDAYIQPLFDSFGFLDDEGNNIDSHHNLYRCVDEAMCKRFYAESDAAHRANGFTGPAGHCPALRAESLQSQAEQHLIKAGCELFGIAESSVYGDNRDKMLNLLLKSCLGVAL